MRILTIAHPSHIDQLEQWKSFWNAEGANDSLLLSLRSDRRDRMHAFRFHGTALSTDPQRTTCPAKYSEISGKWYIPAANRGLRGPQRCVLFSPEAVGDSVLEPELQHMNRVLQGQVSTQRPNAGPLLFIRADTEVEVSDDTDEWYQSSHWVNPLLFDFPADATELSADESEIWNWLLDGLEQNYATVCFVPVFSGAEVFQNCLLEELTKRLAEGEEGDRNRSTVESILWGVRRGTYRHNLIMALAGLGGTLIAESRHDQDDVSLRFVAGSAGPLSRPASAQWCRKIGAEVGTDSSWEILPGRPASDDRGISVSFPENLLPEVGDGTSGERGAEIELLELLSQHADRTWYATAASILQGACEGLEQQKSLAIEAIESENSPLQVPAALTRWRNRVIDSELRVTKLIDDIFKQSFLPELKVLVAFPAFATRLDELTSPNVQTILTQHNEMHQALLRGDTESLLCVNLVNAVPFGAATFFQKLVNGFEREPAAEVSDTEEFEWLADFWPSKWFSSLFSRSHFRSLFRIPQDEFFCLDFNKLDETALRDELAAESIRSSYESEVRIW